MIYNINSNGIEFPTIQELSMNQQNILKELLENGFIENSEEKSIIDESSYFELTIDDLKTLEIFNLFSFKIVNPSVISLIVA